MIKFLLDANLSPETAVFLRDLNYDVKSLLEENWGQMSDEEIIKLAQKEKRMIITHDLDFGEVYHFRQEGKVGILVLRLRDQTIESVNKILEKFLAKRIFKKQKLARSLITLAETSYRVYQKSN